MEKLENIAKILKIRKKSHIFDYFLIIILIIEQNNFK